MRVASLSSVTARVPRRVSSRLHAWIAAAILACAGSFFLASPAFAESSLAVSLAAPVSAVGASLDLSLAISLDGPWIDASTVVEVRGPGSPMAGGAEWPVVARIERREGDLGSGEFGLDITLQPEDLPEPGAYLLSVDLIGADGKRLTTRSWCGRISNLPARVDLAVVLPVVSGIRRDPEGAFIDDLVQRAVVPEADQEGSLYGLFSAVEQNRDWHLTLGVEPLFLAQLRDLADGYRERIGGGAVREVPAGEGAARDAEQALAAFRGVAALASVQAIPAPYAMPALPILAREGWRDGFEQMQLGKLELQSTLQVAAIPDGAYAPGLDVTTDSLGAFSRASIDYIVVREDVARDLAEAPSGGGKPVRVQNRENDRLTLVLANEELRAAMAPPWDLGRFAAALAAALASGDSDLLVAAPADDYAMPPAGYLRELGAFLTGTQWIRTVTLDEALQENPPETRPIFLSRYGGFVESYMGQAFVAGLKTAHTAVDALAGAADSERTPVSDLRRMLFEAESRYWFLAGLAPDVANLGLSYLDAIERIVTEEFDKVDIAGDMSVIFVGGKGELPIAVVNQAGYPMNLRMVVAGAGVQVGGGGVLDVTLGEQENIFSVPVTVRGGTSTVNVRVMAGDIVVDEETIEIHSIPVGPVIAWGVAIVVLTALIGWAVLRLR